MFKIVLCQIKIKKDLIFFMPSHQNRSHCWPRPLILSKLFTSMFVEVHTGL
jgi:hypothetical protein